MSYNTGNEGWVYNDNVNSPVIREWLGKTVGKEGETLDRWLGSRFPLPEEILDYLDRLEAEREHRITRCIGRPTP